MIGRIATAVFFLALMGMKSPAPQSPSLGEDSAPLSLWRLDCGKYILHNFGGLGPREMASGCYLIRHGETYMLWEAGVPEELIGNPSVSAEQTISLSKALIPQLAEIKVKPEHVSLLGISHYHTDHIGQAIRFPGATLLIGKDDLAVLKTVPTPAGRQPERIKPWIEGKSSVVEVTGNIDIFGDGSVKMLPTPGHTPGHYSLLVNLASGPVILSGDFVHYRDQLASGEVSGNNVDKAASKASMTYVQEMAARLKAKIIVQHDPADIPILPPFPTAAR